MHPRFSREDPGDPSEHNQSPRGLPGGRPDGASLWRAQVRHAPKYGGQVGPFLLKASCWRQLFKLIELCPCSPSQTSRAKVTALHGTARRKGVTSVGRKSHDKSQINLGTQYNCATLQLLKLQTGPKPCHNRRFCSKHRMETWKTVGNASGTAQPTTSTGYRTNKQICVAPIASRTAKLHMVRS